ncbi:hypothetical protein Vretifemale_20580 [Volvox reticuliferus]|uniref:Copper homeostasis protein cutC homolog n=1 Tax=Volvox reticuliferus TaxID=1737510 RepID=A0A8J4D053_9CHLO|nr:hypothetical protein Vretifemale_20580 [Volvox reticuliferus]
MLVEVCIDSVHGALAAQSGGADRVELCAALVEGGITPSAGLITACRKAFQGKLMVIIRPRGGDFLYTEEEENVMQEDIRQAKVSGADGVVFGCLQSDGTVDMDATGRLLRQAQMLNLDVTFHRAFDMTPDPVQALDDLLAVGVPRVLTSGCKLTALQGADTIAELVHRSAGRITVLAGGGVTPTNAAELVRRTGVTEIHSTAKRRHVSKMSYRRPGLSMASSQPPNDFEWNVADTDVVRQLVQAISS